MKRGALAALAVAAVLAASGCATTPQDPGTGNGSDEPQYGGTILTQQRYVIPGGLNYLTNADPGLHAQIAPSYSKLVDYGTDADTLGIEVVADLAESWEISDDGLTYTFHLDPDAVFHDIEPVNGRPVTAADVVATFEAIIELKSSTSYQFAQVASIEADGDSTVVFTLTQPVSTFLENLATYGNYIAPIEGIEGTYDMDTTVIGSGPFVLVDYDPASIWERVRFDEYFQEGRPYADGMNTVIVPDAAARFAALRSGQLNHAIIAQPEQVQQLVATGDFESVSQPVGPEMIYFNTSVAPFDDLRVRQAIAQAIDWDGMGESVRQVYSLTSVIPGNLGGVGEDELRELRPHDPEAAKDLLADAGYPDGFAASMVVQQIDGNDVSEAEWIVEDLKAIGIDLTLELVDAATYASRRGGGQFEMARGLRTLVSADQYMTELRSGSPTNFTKVADPVLDGLIDDYRAELDPEARRAIAEEFTRYFEEEVLTIIAGPLTYETYVWSSTLHNPYTSVDGLSPTVIRYGSMLKHMWLEQD